MLLKSQVSFILREYEECLESLLNLEKLIENDILDAISHYDEVLFGKIVVLLFLNPIKAYSDFELKIIPDILPEADDETKKELLQFYYV